MNDYIRPSCTAMNDYIRPSSPIPHAELSLHVSPPITSSNSADEWLALGYLAGGNAFASAAANACYSNKLRARLEGAADKYFEAALKLADRMKIGC